MVGPGPRVKYLAEGMAGPGQRRNNLGQVMVGPGQRVKYLAEGMAGPCQQRNNLGQVLVGPGQQVKYLAEGMAGPDQRRNTYMILSSKYNNFTNITSTSNKQRSLLDDRSWSMMKQFGKGNC